MENRMYADRPCDGGHHEHGFKFLLPLVVVPVAFGMLRHFGRHKFEHMRAMHAEQGENFVPPMFAEWHRRAHAAAEKPAPPAEKQPPVEEA
jgi:hypothetical protein